MGLSHLGTNSRCFRDRATRNRIRLHANNSRGALWPREFCNQTRPAEFGRRVFLDTLLCDERASPPFAVVTGLMPAGDLKQVPPAPYYPLGAPTHDPVG